ncbi:hypothetical protein SCR05_08430 [Streptococcus canis]|uniref:hypothetical protein n=1 Tax=Streptococcus canis TaxID=1329 RepID=UPI00298DEDCF|nr:hypothetical protein [Streptococcus canis]MDW7797574.1 hypothetical protein [Streptococcus canis]
MSLIKVTRNDCRAFDWHQKGQPFVGMVSFINGFLGYQKAVQEYDLNIHLLGKEISFEGGILLGKAIAQ